jgi:lysozyme
MITEDGLALIRHFEGCKLSAYKDTAGILTIGYGHTKGVKQGEITQEQADQFLLDDLKDAESRLNSLLKAEINQAERDSLISSAFNLRSFPVLIAHLNKEGRKVYLEKLLLYCHDIKGHTLFGLLLRRYAEKYRFEGDTWPEIQEKLKSIKNEG